MRLILLILWLGLLWAQELRFELQPGAFPAEVGGVSIFQPWVGATRNTTPEFSDIDADGDLDYFCGSYGYCWFFENQGTTSNPQFQYVTGMFDSLTFLGGSFAGYESNLTLVDLDADGDYDFIASAGFMGVCWNQGDSVQWNFANGFDSLYDVNGQVIGTVRFELADIDGDGDYDLFTEDWSPAALRFWENIGTPENYAYQMVTANWQNLQVGGGGSLSPCFGDLDADGDLDLLVGTGAGTLYYYQNDGTAQNANMVLVSNNYLNLDVGEDASPELADIDGDGDLDLFVGRSLSSATYFQQGDVFFLENDGSPQNADFRLITTNYMVFDIGEGATPSLIDIDADGDPDLISRKGDNLLLYRNQGDLQQPSFIYDTETFGGVNVNTIMPWFVDLDADGDYDLLAGEGAIPGPPGLHYFRNDGTPQNAQYLLVTDDLLPGIFTQNTVLLIPGTCDIDADGDQDLFISGSDNYFYFFLNTGTSSHFQFQYMTNNWQNLADWSHRHFCFYYVDQDSDQDLFIYDEAPYNQPWDKNLMFYRNVGTPQVAQMVLESADLFPELMIWQASPFLIDMDQDGDGDMFLGDTWGGIRYFKNVTGDTSAVGPPPVYRHPRAGLQISLGPNPANPVTAISYKLQAAGQISLEVFDISGRKLVELTSGFHLPGEYRYVWDAGKNASGMYFVRLRAGEQRMIEKVIMLK